MTYQDLLDLLFRFGLPTVIVLALFYFAWKELWPVIIEQYRASQKERDSLIKTLSDSVTERNNDRLEVQSRMAKEAIERVQDRNQMIELMRQTSQSNMDGQRGIINALGDLTRQIRDLQNTESENQRKLMETISDIAIKGRSTNVRPS